MSGTAPPGMAPIYIFLDEGGDLNFSPWGSKYFTMTSVAVSRPFPWGSRLADLRYELIESGLSELGVEFFHASEDRQAVRDRVFAIIQASLASLRADSIVVEKCKTGPALRDDRRFYPEILGYLLRYVIKALQMSSISEAIVVTDRIPINAKRKAVEKAIKETLAKMLPSGVRYRLLHHESKTCHGLQVADYINWAVFRSWERNDDRSLDLVRPAVKSQFDIFRLGTIKWY